jgi:hypothetical protein
MRRRYVSLSARPMISIGLAEPIVKKPSPIVEKVPDAKIFDLLASISDHEKDALLENALAEKELDRA